VPRFRSKPAVIEAERFDLARTREAGYTPRGVYWQPGRDGGLYYVITMHGDRARLKDGDYVVAEPDGVHFYPCDATVFAARWEPVPE
jgi:hypothetical protein